MSDNFSTPETSGYLQMSDATRRAVIKEGQKNPATRIELLEALNSLTDVVIGLTEASLELSQGNMAVAKKLQETIQGLKRLQAVSSLMMKDDVALRSEDGAG